MLDCLGADMWTQSQGETVVGYEIDMVYGGESDHWIWASGRYMHIVCPVTPEQLQLCVIHYFSRVTKFTSLRESLLFTHKDTKLSYQQ